MTAEATSHKENQTESIDLNGKKTAKIKLSVGEKKWFVVQESTSAGYVWQIEDPTEKDIFVKIVKTQYKPNLAQGTIGANPNFWILIEAVSVGSQFIQMKHVRPWDEKSVIQTIKLTFEIV